MNFSVSPMNTCTNLYFLSTIACQLSECLDEDDLAVLAADLVVLSDMLANIIARKAACSSKVCSEKTYSEKTCPKETCLQEVYPKESCPKDTCLNESNFSGQTSEE